MSAWGPALWLGDSSPSQEHCRWTLEVGLASELLSQPREAVGLTH